MSHPSSFLPSSQSGQSWVQWLGVSALISGVLSTASQGYVNDSVKWLILGSLIEAGRRVVKWLIDRCRFQYSITLEFNEGNPSYEWVVNFLTQEKIWRRSREFRVHPQSSQLKWGVKSGSNLPARGSAIYVPTYALPQLFWWNGYFMEVKRDRGAQSFGAHGPVNANATLFITLYTIDMSVMEAFVEEARRRYAEANQPNVIIHLADTPSFGPEFVWSNSKRKTKRPLDSIILEEGVIESLLQDAREFISSEEWYVSAGIPHRRGYLLYGPPGTGKTSTIYALAGELGFEIYSLSLASGFVDDSLLQRAASSMPKGSILLIEDIDCCFSREEEDEQARMYMTMTTPYGPPRKKSSVTLSGLLNVIDGVGSDDGRLFFATTNYIDRLDRALLRPGRIDKKVEYHLATKDQARMLFIRFFPPERFDDKPLSTSLSDLASDFAEAVTGHGFSTADLQGYLLAFKKEPEQAVKRVHSWIEEECALRTEREEREKRREERIRTEREKQILGPVMPSMLVGGR